MKSRQSLIKYAKLANWSNTIIIITVRVVRQSLLNFRSVKRSGNLLARKRLAYLRPLVRSTKVVGEEAELTSRYAPWHRVLFLA